MPHQAEVIEITDTEIKLSCGHSITQDTFNHLTRRQLRETLFKMIVFLAHGEVTLKSWTCTIGDNRGSDTTPVDNDQFSISETDNLLLNISGGLRKYDLTEKERVLLRDRFGQNWEEEVFGK